MCYLKVRLHLEISCGEVHSLYWRDCQTLPMGAYAKSQWHLWYLRQ